MIVLRCLLVSEFLRVLDNRICKLFDDSNSGLERESDSLQNRLQFQHRTHHSWENQFTKMSSPLGISVTRWLPSSHQERGKKAVQPVTKPVKSPSAENIEGGQIANREELNRLGSVYGFQEFVCQECAVFPNRLIVIVKRSSEIRSTFSASSLQEFGFDGCFFTGRVNLKHNRQDKLWYSTHPQL